MKSNRQIVYGLVLIVALVALFDLFRFYLKGGFDGKKSFGVEFNYRRGKMGIPPVERNWKDSDEKPLLWLDTTRFHRSKIVILNSDNSNREVDEFFFSQDSVLVHYGYYQRSNEKADSCRCELKIKEKKERINYDLCKELMYSRNF